MAEGDTPTQLIPESLAYRDPNVHEESRALLDRGGMLGIGIEELDFWSMHWYLFQKIETDRIL